MLKIDELDTIKYLVKCIVDKIYPLRVYLFGSFAVGKNNANSDYDFYVIMPDDTPNNLYRLMAKAQVAVLSKTNRSVDILIKKNCDFELNKNTKFTFENLIHEKGVLLYEQKSGMAGLD
ncbi:MAG: nucleotidyltransferase domain-containing protein [Selenomonadales bacterium]|nr:nucleotidyltransferase domain-containing protein [Selenomonadales bacterium]MDY3740174.1 nucleotidyltransferase domain-containing protein [Selenomonadaceae bacterium]MEE1361563.1 nucleotidyltransferase domain-containing protein [Selenomonadaceae bacterium]